MLSGAVPQRFAERAMDAVRTSLVSRGSQAASLLLDAALRPSAQEPGYIKGYPPGIRENGGQYTHAAVWVVMALARLGSGDEVGRALPHAQPDQPHANAGATWSATRPNRTWWRATSTRGRRTPAAAGWSWYTGSAAWLYRAGLESMLGLRRRGATFSIDPCIPSTWPGYEITWTVGGTIYEIVVTNPDSQCRGVRSATLDGVPMDAAALPLSDDGRTHGVRIVLGTSGNEQPLH